ncbi:MAG: bacillithiol system redox-active protein YtxJ [Flavobacteriaceae bacterium]|nr:bacillithiol system redox-active protein YtxJ [Flavobacteriaceae bacterium]|tara:strand:+ start:245214 stop:245552 length:339 start_codon:yes stop_codon:yes gene_type:complete
MSTLFTPFTQAEQLENMLEESITKPVLIFKHSTRCGISRMVLKRFENSVEKYAQQYRLYYLDLLNYRELSNSIADKFEVVHESPQILVIKNGQVVHSASHYDILEINFEKFI